MFSGGATAAGGASAGAGAVSAGIGFLASVGNAVKAGGLGLAASQTLGIGSIQHLPPGYVEDRIGPKRKLPNPLQDAVDSASGKAGGMLNLDFMLDFAPRMDRAKQSFDETFSTGARVLGESGTTAGSNFSTAAGNFLDGAATPGAAFGDAAAARINAIAVHWTDRRWLLDTKTGLGLTACR